jgi:hypothetical protein
MAFPFLTIDLLLGKALIEFPGLEPNSRLNDTMRQLLLRDKKMINNYQLFPFDSNFRKLQNKYLVEMKIFKNHCHCFRFSTYIAKSIVNVFDQKCIQENGKIIGSQILNKFCYYFFSFEIKCL